MFWVTLPGPPIVSKYARDGHAAVFMLTHLCREILLQTIAYILLSFLTVHSRSN